MSKQSAIRSTASRCGMTLIEMVMAMALSALLLVALSGSIALSLRVSGRSSVARSAAPVSGQADFDARWHWHDALRELWQVDFQQAERWRASGQRMLLRGHFVEFGDRRDNPVFADQIEYRLAHDPGGATLRRIVSIDSPDQPAYQSSRVIARWIGLTRARFAIGQFELDTDRLVTVVPDDDRLHDMAIKPSQWRIVGQRAGETDTRVCFACFVTPAEMFVD